MPLVIGIAVVCDSVSVAIDPSTTVDEHEMRPSQYTFLLKIIFCE